MSDTLLLVVIFLMLLVGALEKLFPQKLNMCKILLCIISLILTTSCNRPNIKRSFKERISTLLFTSMLINTYIPPCKPQGLYQSVIRSVHS